MTDHAPPTEHNTSGGFVAWWKSDWGPGPLLALALPLMASAGLVSITLFTDRTLLYWQSETAASAAVGAGTLYWSIICLPMGLLGYISTFVAQYRGAAQPQRIGVAYRHAMVLAWAIVPLLLLAILLGRWFFDAAGHESTLAAAEATYLRILLVGGLGVLFYSVQSGLLTGQGRTGTVLAIDSVATVINLVLDAMLIFGFGPIPAMGIAGAALATTASFWLKIPVAAYVIRRDPQLRYDFGIGQRNKWEPSMLRRLLLYGSPAGLQMLAEAGCFAVIMLQVGKLGELPMAATGLALGLNALVFVPMIGFGIGVGVLVGQHLTEGRVDLARRTVQCGLATTSTYTLVFAIWFALFPEQTLGLYAWGVPPERFDTVRPLLIPLLQIIAIYCVLDGWQIVFVGAIKGAGDTWFVLTATTMVSVAAIVAGMLAERLLGTGLMLWWYVIAGWVALMVVTFAMRYISGRWESKRVIS